MKKIALSFLALILVFGYFSRVANAQSLVFSQEAILSFDSAIIVNIDNSINVSETIQYTTGAEERHGIYRDIYPYSSENKRMNIGNIVVTDENGTNYQFQVSEVNEYIRIKIGDPDRTFHGQKTYVIKYRATRAVAQLDSFDEIYWNVTGNEWVMPIYRAQASACLPSGGTSTQSACYFGLKGSKDKCQLISEIAGTSMCSAPSVLGPRQGLTVAVGFPKGIVAPYTSSDATASFFDRSGSWLVAILLPILTLLFSLMYWYKKGRDARGTDVIVPQYDAPHELTPMEIGGIINEKVDVRNISAEIIYLATKGYLKINQLDERYIGISKTPDYQLEKLKDFSDLQNDFDKKLLAGLFNSQPRSTLSSFANYFVKDTTLDENQTLNTLARSVKLSNLKNVFYKDELLVVVSVADALLAKGYYKNLGKMKNGGMRLSFIVILSLLAIVFLGEMFNVLHIKGDPFPFVAGTLLSFAIYGVVSYFNPAKTEKGVIAKEYILGLKDYLQIAEKDRLQFHNAPEKKPEIFEKLLPYAMVLGVSDIWAKEFEGIYTVPPSWYSGPSEGAFSAVAFSKIADNFNTFAENYMLATPRRSGGSGGSGFSGGGGGGGGGGSW